MRWLSKHWFFVFATVVTVVFFLVIVQMVAQEAADCRAKGGEMYGKFCLTDDGRIIR